MTRAGTGPLRLFVAIQPCRYRLGGAINRPSTKTGASAGPLLHRQTTLQGRSLSLMTVGTRRALLSILVAKPSTSMRLRWYRLAIRRPGCKKIFLLPRGWRRRLQPRSRSTEGGRCGGGFARMRRADWKNIGGGVCDSSPRYYPQKATLI
jgi:hypothetical protein